MSNDPIYVRPSSHSSWQLCQLSVQSKDDPRHDDTPSMQSARGTGVHFFNESHLSGHCALCDATWGAPIAATLELWLDHMAERGEPINGLATVPRLREIAAEIYSAHMKWVVQFYEPIMPGLKIVSTEQTMEMDIGFHYARPIILRGTADLITSDNDLHVWDWKTASAGWTRHKVDEQTQHLFYAALAKHQYPDLADLPMGASYVVYDFKRGTWNWSEYTVAVDDEKIHRAIGEMVKMGKVLAEQAAMASPSKKGASWGQDGRGWWCSAKWCGAWDFCEGKHILDDGKTGGRRDSNITWR